jgi:hypothetical protein
MQCCELFKLEGSKVEGFRAEGLKALTASEGVESAGPGVES